MTNQIPSIHADAARVVAGPHTVHVELAMSRPDGSYQPALHLALPAAAASELAALLIDAARAASRG